MIYDISIRVQVSFVNFKIIIARPRSEYPIGRTVP